MPLGPHARWEAHRAPYAVQDVPSVAPSPRRPALGILAGVRIAVAGATGSIGRPVAAELERRGHEVRGLSRRAPEFPVDLTTGAGLTEALTGCEVLIDASNAGPAEKPARAVLIEGGRRLLDAAEAAGVVHHVCISIVGIEHVPLPYYRLKVEQEDLVRGSGPPATIVRSTQFHTLIAGLFDAAARIRLLPGGSARLQPVDPDEVATAIADVAEGPARTETITIAGPEIVELGALARSYRENAGIRALVIPAPLPPKLGRALRAGSLTDPAPDHRGEVEFGAWLRARGSSD